MEFSKVLVLDLSGGYIGVVITAVITEINTCNLCTSLNVIL